MAKTRSWSAAAAILAAAMLSACGGGASLGDDQTSGGALGGGTTGTTTGGSSGGTTGGTTPGAPAILEVASAQDQILADGTSSALLTATLSDTQGVAISGESLSFTTNAGTLTAASGTTNAAGQVQVRLRAGTTAVRATVVVRHPSTGLSATIPVPFVAAPVARLTLTATPTTLAPGATASVVLQALDANGNPVEGEPLALDTTVNNSGGRFEQLQLVTDANGFATARYFAGTTVGADTLRARAAAGTGALAPTQTLNIQQGAAQVGSLALQAAASQIVANGSSEVAIRATVRDLSNTLMTGQSVSFTVTGGQFSTGTGAPSANVSATTNSSGIAEVRLRSATVAQTVTVSASTAGFTQSANVSFVPGVPANPIVLELAPSNIAPNDSASVRATVRDANGNAISGLAVNFTNADSSLGRFASASGVTDSNGQVSSVYTANAREGADTVTARLASNGAVTGTGMLNIDNDNASVTGLVLTAGSAQVAPGSTVTIRATVSTSSGEIAGKSVSFTTLAAGANLSPGTAATNGRGEADVTLTAPTDPGIVTIRASIGGFNASIDIQVGAGVPATLDLFVFDAPSMPYNSTTTLRATVLDANRNPVPDVTVLFDVDPNASRGTLASASATTDANGRATTTYTAGPGGAAVVIDTLSVRLANSAVADATVNLNITPHFGSLTLEAVSPTLTANGTSQTLVRATVKDVAGNPVRNAAVTFSASAGTLTPLGSVSTNAQGEASVTLKSSTTAGEAVVRADITNGFSETAVVTFVADAADALDVVALPATLSPGGSSTLRARLQDSNDNPVPNATVQFLLPAGSQSRLSAAVATTDDSGEAEVTYTQGGAPGTETVTVRTASGALSGSVNVTATTTSQVIGSISLSLGATSVPAGAADVAVRARVLDTAGTPVVGASVDFDTTGGDFTGATTVTGTTDSNGIAEVKLTPPTQTGTLRLSAVSAGFRDEATLPVVPGPASAAQSIIAATPSAILADGSTTSTITVVLNDQYGNSLEDGTSVVLAANRGVVLTNTQPLASGRATFTLRSDAQAGTATVSVAGVTGLSTSVTFESASTGDPASLRFSSTQTRISVTGVGQGDQTQITVTVLDSAGNPIDESRYANAALNNLRAQFVSRPNGGESLSGTDASSTIVVNDTAGVLDVRTRGGTAIFTLRSGTLSGVVEIRFSVLEFTGTDFTVPADVAAVGALPQVSIASGPPHTVAFTSPITNAIEDLNNGNYRMKGKVDVVDRYGNSVPDGTVVNFALMDSVILHDASGVTAAASASLTRSGDSLIQRRCTTEPTVGGEAAGCGVRGALTDASSFSSSITRNDVARFIQAGDIVAIRNSVSADKKRSVAQVDSATQLTANTNYSAALSNGEFWVGASLLGAQIAGIDGGALIAGTGVVTDGIAEFRVTYPANVRTILSGCYGYPYPDRSYDDRDRRDSVPQSRQVITVASAGDAAVAVDAGQFCFKAIAGGTLTPTVADVALAQGASQSIGLVLRDGGDTIPLPYVPLACFVSTLTQTDADSNPATLFSLTVSVGTNTDGAQETDVSGAGSVTITNTGNDKGSATVTCVGSDASTTITVSGL